MKENIWNKILSNGSFISYRYLKMVIVFGLMIMFGCKAKKQLVATRVAVDTPAKPVNTITAKLDAIRSRQIYFNTFSGKAKTKLDINGNSNDVTLNIRIQRDKKIWVSITAIAGIEVARALITPDSIMVINRLQSVYIRQPFSYIYKFTGKRVNYKTVESLLVGNAIPDLLNDNDNLQAINGNTTITGNFEALTYKLLIGADMKVTQTNLEDKPAAQSLQVANNAFIQTGGKVMPSQIDIASMVKDKKIKVNLHYNKTDFDQVLQYQFSIPARYTPAD